MIRRDNLPMTSWGDEVQHGMHSVVPESRVTLDTRLLGQDIVILSLEVADDFGEAICAGQLMHRR